jgi:hypothetical protein
MRTGFEPSGLCGVERSEPLPSCRETIEDRQRRPQINPAVPTEGKPLPEGRYEIEGVWAKGSLVCVVCL